MNDGDTAAGTTPDGLFRDRVRERDLDNFLVEELHASTAFLDWTLARVEHVFDRPASRPALQKSPPRVQDRRQTDVRIGWFDSEGGLAACVLVESKVTADFQLGQAQSYAGELAALRAALGARSAAALLVAPRARLSGLAHEGAFDAELPIEDIVGFLEVRRSEDLPAELDARIETRVQLLEALCGKRASASWIGATVQEKRDFADAYAELAASMLPSLRVRPSTDGPKAITRIFEGLDLPGLPRTTLRHEFGAGVEWKYANIQFAGAVDAVGAVRDSGILAGTRYTAEPTGQRLARRVRTPGVDPTRPFEEERDAVTRGLEAIVELVSWATERTEALAALIPSGERAGVVAAKPEATVTPTLERAFGEELRRTYRECERLGYRPTGMLGMIDQHGAFETARRLLSRPATEGLARLTMLGRLDLSVERIVLDERWRGAFTEGERAAARKRLR